MYKLLFDEKVVKDLRKIDKAWQLKILSVTKSKLIENPYVGKKLVGDLSPLYRLRIGNYRVIYDIVEKEVIVVVIKIKHRKDAYK
ncbi:MAG: type II toxin-antitoxin system RelE/ParE family toxin [Gammaproteobacteria bacterium]|nr:type II toxin-antitoxin system RelE/ParE family toxin [Gammaproteobacteria bacterium]